MALITTIKEVKDVLRISSLDDDMSLPDMDQAQTKHLIPVLGAELLDSLEDVQEDNTATDEEKHLIKLIQKPLAAYAYLDDIGIIHATITDRGVARISTSEMPSAYRWEFEEVKSTLEDKALVGMEQMLFYLESKKSLFPEWTGSPQYKLKHQYLINNGNEFSRYYTLYHPLRTFQSLTSVMQLVEDMYVIPAIGFDFKQGLIENPPNDADSERLLALLKKAEAYLTIKHAIEMLPVRISDNGFTVFRRDINKPESDRQPAPDNLLSLKLQSADRDGQNYLKMAVNMLNEKASPDLWEKYYNSDHYKDPKSKKEWSRNNQRRKIFRL